MLWSKAIARSSLCSSLALSSVGLACTPGPGEGETATPPSTSSSSSAAPIAPIEAQPESGPDGDESETEASKGEVETIEVGDASLVLQVETCELKVETGTRIVEQHFEFPAQCHLTGFGAEGGPAVVQTDAGPALLIESSKPLEPPDQGCDTALRLVVITRKGPMLSRQVQRVAGCRGSGWDEMMFHVLSGDLVAFGA